jgi:septal ring-binding cell division protein DamX
MDITIKIIRYVAVANLTILGIAGCSSTPAPWTQTQENESPWGAKYATEEANPPSDVVASDSTLIDPVLLADPEPVFLEEPVDAPAPEVIVPVVVEEQTPEEEIMALPGESYAVQVFASKNAENVEKYKDSKNLVELKTVRTDRSGSIVYVLVDIYPDRSSANAAATDLEMKTGSKPWVRSVAGLQKIIAL